MPIPTPSPEDLVKKAIAGDAAMMAAMAKGVYEKYGDEGLAAMARGMQEAFTPLAQSIGKRLGVPIGKGEARDWVKLDGFMGSGMAMQCKFTQVSDKGAYVTVTECPYADQVKRIFPAFCRKVLIGVERAIAQSVNPSMEAHGEKYLPEGDDVCEIHADLRK
ncbi:MAG: L-2-amino-thiazoline-4-carboxylic acid hydrolase [Chloroflexi bacterium]|nr:L-2-amino-thiazoline-4-carboxylic acid hydrolase [Chloroflexota bacterium]